MMFWLKAPVPIDLKPTVAFFFYWSTYTNVEVRVNFSDFAVYILIKFNFKIVRFPGRSSPSDFNLFFSLSLKHMASRIISIN